MVIFLSVEHMKGQNSTGHRSDDSSSDEPSDDNGDTQGVGDAIGSDSDAETKAGDRKCVSFACFSCAVQIGVRRRLLTSLNDSLTNRHTRSPSIQPQDFVVPHSTMEKQSGSLLRRVSVEVRPLAVAMACFKDTALTVSSLMLLLHRPAVPRCT